MCACSQGELWTWSSFTEHPVPISRGSWRQRGLVLPQAVLWTCGCGVGGLGLHCWPPSAWTECLCVPHLACNAGNPGSIPGLGRSPGEENGKPLQYSCLENPMDRGVWWATVHGSQRVEHNWTEWLTLSLFHLPYFTCWSPNPRSDQIRRQGLWKIQ